MKSPFAVVLVFAGIVLAGTAAPLHASEGWLLIDKSGRDSLVYATGSGMQTVAELGDLTIYANPAGRLGIITRDKRQESGQLLVVDKATYGAFCRTRLESELRARGVTTCVIAGVTADVCVHTTLREATDRGFDCLYVRDAISTFDPEVRAACEKMITMEGGIWGTLTTVAALENQWGGAS